VPLLLRKSTGQSSVQGACKISCTLHNSFFFFSLTELCSPPCYVVSLRSRHPAQHPRSCHSSSNPSLATTVRDPVLLACVTGFHSRRVSKDTFARSIRLVPLRTWKSESFLFTFRIYPVDLLSNSQPRSLFIFFFILLLRRQWKE
jgi:hypothetical protein